MEPMRVLHVTSKVIIALIEIGLVALLLVSVIPLATGGIQADMVKDPDATLNPDGTAITIEGEAYVENQMMWNIGLSYNVIIGTADHPVASSDPVDVTVVKGEITYLPFSIEIPVMTSAMYMISTYSDGTIKLPAIFHLNGDYIDKIIGFDVNVDFTMTVQSAAPVMETDGKNISGSGSFDSPVDLPVMNKTLELSISNDSGAVVTGSFTVIVNNESNISYTFNFGSGTGPDLITAIESAMDAEGHLIIDLGTDGIYNLNADQTQTFIDTVRTLLNMAVVV